MLSLKQIERPYIEMDEDWNESSQTNCKLAVEQVKWIILVHLIK